MTKHDRGVVMFCWGFGIMAIAANALAGIAGFALAIGSLLALIGYRALDK